ncbi:hypothetical protein Tco_1488410, partial [Tanacetum coccineum]
FVPQQELSAEQAFHFKMSNPSNDSSDASPVKVDVPSELAKYSVDKQCLEIANKQALNENDRLLEQIISQDIVNIIVNSSENMNTFVNVKSMEMYKLDLVVLAPRDKNNKETHIYYLKRTMEQAVILREIVEQAKSLNPLDIKPSTSASESKPSSNIKNDRISRPPSSNEKNKVEVQSRKVKSGLKKKNSDSKNVCNEHVKHHVKGAKALCSICNACMFDDNHAMCLIDHENSMNVRPKTAFKKNKKRKEWKPTGKVFNSIGYNWKPTGRTFTLVENTCPLTRITITNEVTIREPIPLKVVAQNLVVTKVYTRRPKVPKSVSNSKPKIIKSPTANKMEPDKSRVSDTSVALSSSSLIKYKLSKLYCGIWTTDALSTLPEIALSSPISFINFSVLSNLVMTKLRRLWGMGIIR